MGSGTAGVHAGIHARISAYVLWNWRCIIMGDRTYLWNAGLWLEMIPMLVFHWYRYVLCDVLKLIFVWSVYVVIRMLKGKPDIRYNKHYVF